MGPKIGSFVADPSNCVTLGIISSDLALLIDEVLRLHKYHEDGCLWADIWRNALQSSLNAADLQEKVASRILRITQYNL